MLKITILLPQIRLAYTKTNKNELYIDNDISIGSDKINDKITNFSSNIKKMSFQKAFFIFKANLTFTQ